MALDQNRPGTLIAAVLFGQLPQAGALFHRHHVGVALAGLAARDGPGAMPLTVGATAVGFSAPPLLEIEGPLHHRLGTLEALERGAERGVSAPELLPQFGDVVGQSAHVILIRVQTFKQNLLSPEESKEKRSSDAAGLRKARQTPVSRGPPQCLNRRIKSLQVRHWGRGRAASVGRFDPRRRNGWQADRGVGRMGGETKRNRFLRELGQFKCRGPSRLLSTG